MKFAQFASSFSFRVFVALVFLAGFAFGFFADRFFFAADFAPAKKVSALESTHTTPVAAHVANWLLRPTPSLDAAACRSHLHAARSGHDHSTHAIACDMLSPVGIVLRHATPVASHLEA